MKVILEESANIAILPLMNAAKVIEEIDALSAEEQTEVIAHLHQVQEERFHQEQVRIAEQRLEDLDNGLTGTVPLEEAMRMIREA
jgi:ABC-type phosphate/phosphonate transport system ATPase subunit